MDKTELLEIFTRQQRIELEYPDIQREVDGPVIRHVSLVGDDGFVIYSRLDENSVEEAISAQIARFQSIPQDFEWKTYDYDLPSDLVERLRRRGFEIRDPEALLVLDLATEPEVLHRPVPSSVVRLTDPAGIDAVVALVSKVWNEDHHPLGEFLKRDLQQHPELHSMYVSYEGGQLVSAAWTYFQPGSRSASLYGGSTLPEYRHQGHYSNLLAARLQEARLRGFSLISVDASPMSRPILEKFGFQYLATTTPCKWKFSH